VPVVVTDRPTRVPVVVTDRPTRVLPIRIARVRLPRRLFFLAVGPRLRSRCLRSHRSR
jgi:hypothetical protein